MEVAEGAAGNLRDEGPLFLGLTRRCVGVAPSRYRLLLPVLSTAEATKNHCLLRLTTASCYFCSC